MGAGAAPLEGYYFSAALSCTFLVSCLLFSAFSRALREPYMDEIFHLPQAQRYCEGHFSLSQVGPAPVPRVPSARGRAGPPRAGFSLPDPQRPALPPPSLKTERERGQLPSLPLRSVKSVLNE